MEYMEHYFDFDPDAVDDPEGLMLWEREETKRKYKEQNSAYRKTPKGRVSAQSRRALVRNTQATLTPEEWEDILRFHGYCCHYCSQSLWDKATMDHVVPVSKGGGLTKENIVPSCKSCNSSKGTKSYETFRRKAKKWQN